MPARTGSADDTLPYGATPTSASGFDTNPHAATNYGHYDPDATANLASKRRRLVVDDVPPPPYTGAVTSAAGPADLSAYGAPRAAYHNMALPVSSSPYGLPIQTTAATLGYNHAATHAHHPLNRLDTQQLGGAHGPGSAGPGAAFQSPSSRHSPPHAFHYGALQASPSSIGYQASSTASTSGHGLTGSPAGDYRPHPGPLYTSNVSADASPRTHATPNPNTTTTPSGTSTSPPDATANYTAAATGAMAPYTQSISPYSYAQALGDPQSHLAAAPAALGATARANGLPSLDLHVNGSGLGLDLGYDVERHNSGQAS